MNPYIKGYMWSLVIGSVATPLLSWCIHKLVAWRFKKPMNTRVWWIPFMVGVFERAIITTMLGWNVSGAGAFAGTWVVAKCAGGWGAVMRKEATPHSASVYLAGMMGSAISILFALAGGLIIWSARNHLPGS